MDFFNINFIIGFLGVTAVIVVGNVILNIRVYALGVPLLMTEVCFQILIGAILKSCNVRAPFRMSTVRKGEPIRSGVYVLAEDIIAVDAGQGQKYRRQLEARYLASETVQKLCAELDWFWGVTGTVVGVVNIVLLFVGTGENVAFILGECCSPSVVVLANAYRLCYSVGICCHHGGGDTRVLQEAPAG